MDSWLSILGSVASIGSAVYAYRQAVQSHDYAKEVRRMRDELVNSRKLVS